MRPKQREVTCGTCGALGAYSHSFYLALPTPPVPYGQMRRMRRNVVDMVIMNEYRSQDSIQSKGHLSSHTYHSPRPRCVCFEEVHLIFRYLLHTA